jgi:tetratricopeptide (TPR) repeat protein
VALYEAYAYECYLTNQTTEAIIYCSKSLEVWKQKGNIEKLGNCLYFLSRLWWINDNLVKAEYFAAQAIEVLESQPSSGAKAMTYSLMSQLKMFCDLSAECIAWGEKAIALAKELSNTDVLSYALGNVGSVLMRIPALQEKGLAMLKQSLEIATQHNHRDSEGMAYVNMGYNGLITKDYRLAREALAIGIPYCEENHFALWRLYLLTIKAKLKLEIGEWEEAYELAKRTKKRQNLSRFLY